jgi:penicillin-binding protein 1A
VRLSIDSDLQTETQAIVRQEMLHQGRRLGARQASMVLLAPDGAIRALVGGVDHRQSPFNRVVQAKRQPGSSFKPFIYAAALENGVHPNDIRQDRPVRFGGWSPANYGGRYSGAVTVQEALARSINTVASRLAAEVGSRKLGEIAHRFGVASIPDNPGLSVALGAYEVTLLEMTSGFQVFENAGGRMRPYLIDSITTSRGDPLYLHVPSAPIPVYDPGRAGSMVRMMMGVITHGTGTHAFIGRPAAGKTGTSQNWRDAWFVGFTPDYAAGVWVGNDDGRSMAKVTGGSLPADIWRRVMLVAHRGLPPRNFDWLPNAPEPSGPAVVGPLVGDELDPLPPPLTRSSETDGRNPFYEGLAAEFDRVAGPTDREGPPPPPDYALRKSN